MRNDKFYCNDECVIEEIEWDDLESVWIDNLGNCYKSLYDIKELNQLLKDIIIPK